MRKLILVLAMTMLGACSSDDDDSVDNTLLAGLQTGATMGNVDETMAALETSLSENDAITIVSQIDHQANAANFDLELRPTRVTLFGNPLLGTPLMQINQLAGLDLPQKMFAWTDENGQSNIAYNSAAYLSGRHDLGEAQATLDTIDGALASLASAAGGQEFTPSEVSVPASGEGIIVELSENDMDTTYNNLRNAIESAEALILVRELDHSDNAAGVDLTLPPTRLIIFGNPNLGTPLMQSGQSIGIDLPQKMLVYENSEGEVFVAYNDPAYLARRHGITDQQEVIEMVTQALSNLAAAATTAL